MGHLCVSNISIFVISTIVDDDGAQLTTRDLDECHGKWHGSEYRYHVTADYPYFINCFRGRVPAQNKQTPVRRRGRRSYSWREAARLPEWEQTFQLPLKMGDCKVCSSVKSCRNTGTAINSHSTRYPQTAGTETWNMPDNRLLFTFRIVVYDYSTVYTQVVKSTKNLSGQPICESAGNTFKHLVGINQLIVHLNCSQTCSHNCVGL